MIQPILLASCVESSISVHLNDLKAIGVVCVVVSIVGIVVIGIVVVYHKYSRID